MGNFNRLRFVQQKFHYFLFHPLYIVAAVGFVQLLGLNPGKPHQSGHDGQLILLFQVRNHVPVCHTIVPNGTTEPVDVSADSYLTPVL